MKLESMVAVLYKNFIKRNLIKNVQISVDLPL